MKAVDKDLLNCNLCCYHFSIECAYFILGGIGLLYEVSILIVRKSEKETSTTT